MRRAWTCCQDRKVRRVTASGWLMATVTMAMGRMTTIRTTRGDGAIRMGSIRGLALPTMAASGAGMASTADTDTTVVEPSAAVAVAASMAVAAEDDGKVLNR